ncbi:cytidylate kinase-like family protein [[Clostridium] fimetarium]|uniref:Cytidylate kinase n=1 Tax=[Clostridium] fimetarium TaxID=99656 RepID=A0A1I0QL31_9FIRM|nr:cytidylate kinase-like family protein [[Clostridium] fimetarium]SEW27791.1 cytidylate kinase [[Clostridium] fimetarium]
MIISIGREYGSGGHEIGKKLAKKYGIKFYDKQALIKIAKENGYYDEIISFYEEKPVNSLLYAIAMNSYSDEIGEKQFEIIKKITKLESCVIIGRCSNYIFKRNDNFTSVFIHADIEKRIRRVTDIYENHVKNIRSVIENTDKQRASFHNYYTDENWGDSRNYQLTIDSGEIGIDASVELISDFIENKKNNDWIK